MSDEQHAQHSVSTQGGARIYRTTAHVVAEFDDGQVFTLTLEHAADPRWVLAWIRHLCQNAPVGRLTLARIITVCENAGGVTLPR